MRFCRLAHTTTVAAYGRSLLPRFARQLTTSRGRRVRLGKQAHAGVKRTGRFMGAAASDYRPRSLPLLRVLISLPLLSLRSGAAVSAVASPLPREFIGCRPNTQHNNRRGLRPLLAASLRSAANNFTRSSRWCCLGAPSLLTSLRRYPRQHRLAVVAVVAVDILHAVVAIVAVVLCRRFPSLRFSLRLRLRSALRFGRSNRFCSSCLCYFCRCGALPTAWATPRHLGGGPRPRLVPSGGPRPSSSWLLATLGPGRGRPGFGTAVRG